jgi:hypothetical protein
MQDISTELTTPQFLNQYTPPILFTVKQFVEKHAAFTEGGLRDNIFNEETNGLAKIGAVVRNGRRVLINEEKFFEWLESKNQNEDL